MPRTAKKKRAAVPSAGGLLSRPTLVGPLLFLLLCAVVGVAALPVVLGRLANDAGVPSAFLAPLTFWLATTLLALWWSKGTDRAYVALSLLLLGLGLVVQMRLATFPSLWTNLRAWAPLLAGLLGFLLCLRTLNASRLSAALPKVKWLCWLGALAILAILRIFGRNYRGGLFLPGQINPTELVKLLLIAFAAAWLPAHKEGLSRTLCGIPFPPLRECFLLGIVWGIPVLGGIAVQDLGLVLILCLSLIVLLLVLTHRLGWLFFGLGATALAGWAVSLVSAHTRARFDVWLHPFADPTGRGWQIAQSLTAHYAGGFWGTGLGEGSPTAVPIVSSDFIYAALAEEWGLLGCALLLALYWLWIFRTARAAADAPSETLRLFGSGIAALLGVQILLNIGGVTKALPMTGITLPFFSQGGFSLLTILLLCGLTAALSRSTPAPKTKPRRK